jgi:hypothetical protein
MKGIVGLMVKQSRAVLMLFSLGLFVGCSETTDESAISTFENSPVIESNVVMTPREDDGMTSSALEAWDTVDTNEFLKAVSDINDLEGITSELNGGEMEVESIAQYTIEEREYARVWLQFGHNQEIDELNVRFIPAGTRLNPDDETSASYPLDVIQLAGSRLIDGSVTYHGNWDGTIDVYNVPLRWDGIYPAGEQFYKDILKNTKQVFVDPGDDENVIKLIKLIKINVD